MFVIAGIVLGVVSIFAGYLLHGGELGIFVSAWTEFIVIGGGGAGIFLAAAGLDGVKRTIAAFLHLLKPDPFGKKAFTDLLVMLYQMFSVARRDGLLGLESHLEDPKKSAIMSRNATFLHSHEAVHFFTDTLKVIVSGGVQPHSLDEMMEIDIEAVHSAENVVPDAIQNVGDSMPAVGIVACILGVVITMGKIGGDPADIGHAIGVALIGTLLGIFSAYIIFFPIVKAMQARTRSEGMYVACMRQAIYSFARGEPPITCIEFARRCIDPALRPGFDEMDKAVKAAKSG